MNNLTTEQLAELTERINTRLAEFGPQAFAPLVPGVVRIACEMIEAMLDDDEDALVNGYENARSTGYELGFMAATEGALAYERSKADATELACDWPAMPDLEPAKEHPPNDPGNITLVGQRATDMINELRDRNEQLAHVAQTRPTYLGPEPAKRPIGRDRVPTPEAAREKLATALAQGGNGLVAIDSAAIRGGSKNMVGDKARTLVEVDAANGHVATAPLESTRQRREQMDAAREAQNHRAHALAEVGQLRAKAAASDDRTPPTRQQMIAKLQDLAMGGVMPSQRTYNERKPDSWLTATAVVTRAGVSWAEWAEEAGLAYDRGRKAEAA